MARHGVNWNWYCLLKAHKLCTQENSLKKIHQSQ
jgi:hypothetical protein